MVGMVSLSGKALIWFCPSMRARAALQFSKVKFVDGLNEPGPPAFFQRRPHLGTSRPTLSMVAITPAWNGELLSAPKE